MCSRLGLGNSRPAGSICLVPVIATGTTGMLPRVAATKAPGRNRPMPGGARKVPSGKKASDSPPRAALTICRASRALPAAA